MRFEAPSPNARGHHAGVVTLANGLDQRCSRHVEDAVERARRRHPQAHLTITSTRANPPSPAVVRGWAPGLRIAVDNLLENAARHGGPQPRIDVAIDSRPRGEVIVVVDDNGPGVDPDELDHLTERFARGRRTSAPGSGLGLAVVNQQATLHGGHLSLTASHRGGLRAELHLPTALG